VLLLLTYLNLILHFVFLLSQNMSSLCLYARCFDMFINARLGDECFFTIITDTHCCQIVVMHLVTASCTFANLSVFALCRLLYNSDPIQIADLIFHGRKICVVRSNSSLIVKDFQAHTNQFLLNHIALSDYSE
jgi:hypothetical protein